MTYRLLSFTCNGFQFARLKKNKVQFELPDTAVLILSHLKPNAQEEDGTKL